MSRETVQNERGPIRPLKPALTSGRVNLSGSSSNDLNQFNQSQNLNLGLQNRPTLVSLNTKNEVASDIRNVFIETRGRLPTGILSQL